MDDNIKVCRVCSKEINKGAKICPHCGNDQRKFFARHKIILTIGIIFIIFIVVKFLNFKGKNNSRITKETSTSTYSNSKNLKSDGKLIDKNKKYSYSEFMQISMGMTYDQVKKILGSGIEETSSGDGDAKTITYTWKNDDTSNIFVELHGGKVVNKSQAMLNNMNAKVTLDKYNKINMGMNYKQVNEILGNGELASETNLIGDNNEMYEWINDDGSNMNVTFQDGKVDTKTQTELK